jgi:hypothetical protein
MYHELPLRQETILILVVHVKSSLITNSLSISLSFSSAYSICFNHLSETQELVCMSPDVMLFCNQVLLLTCQDHTFMWSATAAPMHKSSPYYHPIISYSSIHHSPPSHSIEFNRNSICSVFQFYPSTKPQDHSLILDDLATEILQTGW